MAAQRQLMIRLVFACLGAAMLFVAPYSYTLVDRSGSGEGRITGYLWHSILEGQPNGLALATTIGRVPQDLPKASFEMRAYLSESYDIERWDLNIGLLMIQWIAFGCFVAVADRAAARFLGLSGKRANKAPPQRNAPRPPPRPPLPPKPGSGRR